MFSGGYRSFFSDSFPLLGPNSCQGSYKGQVRTTELISAVDIYYGNESVYANVIASNTDNTRFLESQFCVELLDKEETAEIAIEYDGDENKCMLDVEKNLRLSWIVIHPTLKRGGNVSSLRPVSVQPYWDGSGIEVRYATILSGYNRGIHTTEFVECRIVAIFGCVEGTNMELKELSLCVVDMYRTRLNGEKSLRILTEAMQRGKRKKANGEENDVYLKYMDLRRKKIDELKKNNMVYERVLCLTYDFKFNKSFTNAKMVSTQFKVSELPSNKTLVGTPNSRTNPDMSTTSTGIYGMPQGMAPEIYTRLLNVLKDAQSSNSSVSTANFCR
ncbi:hypothetical protein AgCh_035993 [Apium graveolens]